MVNISLRVLCHPNIDVLPNTYKELGLSILTHVNSFTRFRTNKGVLSDSYIDYFIVFNIKCYSFEREKPIGRADHMMLQAQFLSSDFRPNNIRKKELVFNLVYSGALESIVRLIYFTKTRKLNNIIRCSLHLDG